MALVKKSTLSAQNKARNQQLSGDAPSVTLPAEPIRPSRKMASRGPLTAASRIDHAVQELASGLGEASAAATELQRTMDQISSGAEEAAGAAQESLGLISALGSSFRKARSSAEDARRQTEGAQASFAEISTQIELSVAAIELSAQRRLSTATQMTTLEQAAVRIDEIAANVADVSEQTSLFALNAAIEAARAGDEGAGFSVVADEVRVLAESSEAGVGNIRSLAATIGEGVRRIADKVRASSQLASSEAKLGHEVVTQLKAARDALVALGNEAQEIVQGALEAEGAAREAQRGSELVASAAEEQSAAASEARQAIEQQTLSLEESQQTAEALGDLTQHLHDNQKRGEVAEQVSASAEQLSATVQELSGASAQILVALDQIGRGTHVQASATAQANVAMGQIEKAARMARSRADAAHTNIAAIVASSAHSQGMVERLAAGVRSSLDEIGEVLELLSELSETGRQIEKITDALALISVQTNMLAVSGAIEATRAGKAGRGFSMVAADIRKLSREAAASAEQTKDTVHLIKDQIGTVRRELDQVVGAAEAEVARNKAMIERFAAVVVELEGAMAMNGIILAESKDMLRAVQEVQSGTGQIAQAADIAAASAREASAAARQQAQGADALAAAIEDIASIAVALAADEA